MLSGWLSLIQVLAGSPVRRYSRTLNSSFAAAVRLTPSLGLVGGSVILRTPDDVSLDSDPKADLAVVSQEPSVLSTHLLHQSQSRRARSLLPRLPYDPS